MKSWFVADDGLRVTDGGFELDVRLPWYRSLPLSVLDWGNIAIDGSAVDHGAITVNLNGEERKLSELQGLWQEYWFVLDSAYLRIPFANAERGEQYDVEIALVIHPPYVPNVFFPAMHKKRMRAN
jgi:hypothetical protein